MQISFTAASMSNVMAYEMDKARTISSGQISQALSNLFWHGSLVYSIVDDEACQIQFLHLVALNIIANMPHSRVDCSLIIESHDVTC